MRFQKGGTKTKGQIWKTFARKNDWKTFVVLAVLFSRASLISFEGPRNYRRRSLSEYAGLAFPVFSL